MPAVSVDDLLVLPRLAAPAPEAVPRGVRRVVTAHRAVEGAGFVVWRPFPGLVEHSEVDPFFLLDQMGPVHYEPDEAVGAPWHPHRGFETVTYLLDGEIAHHDSAGGGGLITEGGTQWMTAGSGLLHDEVPSEESRRRGGDFHGVQLWVNLPSALKFTPPRYQTIGSEQLVLATTHDGGALVRLIAGQVGGIDGPGDTHTPITYLHASVHPGAEIAVPWNADFNALAYVLSGRASVGAERREVGAHELVVFGPGDSVSMRAAADQPDDSPDLEVLLLGGVPIREPIAHYGPFLMNTRAEIIQAVEDFQSGRMGRVPEN